MIDSKKRYNYGYQDGLFAKNKNLPYRPAGILKTALCKHFDKMYEKGYKAGYYN